MNPIVFAMRRPVTTLMMVVALISGGVLAYIKMRVDIFPSLNTPKIYVFLDYIGMSFQEKKAQEGIPASAIFGRAGLSTGTRRVRITPISHSTGVLTMAARLPTNSSSVRIARVNARRLRPGP